MPSITPSRGLTIGALSRRSGVNIETIRYYERIQLIQKPPRTSGGHRSYDPAEVDHLLFIRRARVLGFGIKEIRALLALSVCGANSCAEAREIAAAQLADVRAKQHDLVKLETILADTIAQCDARCRGPVVPACPVFEMLNN